VPKQNNAIKLINFRQLKDFIEQYEYERIGE
jgi:hypothetical protein